MTVAVAVMVTALALSTANADYVVLHNGSVLRGVIREETERQVILEQAHGHITIPRKDIKSIKKTDLAASSRQRVRALTASGELGEALSVATLWVGRAPSAEARAAYADIAVRLATRGGAHRRRSNVSSRGFRSPGVGR